MLEDYSSRKNKFSASYPNIDAVNMDVAANQSVKGRFEDLSMKMVLSVKKASIPEFIDSFNWTIKEESELKALSNKRGPTNMESKKLRHLYELFHMAYTLCMNPVRDMSGYIPCGWQIGYGDR